jgi:hypothetical protein
MSDADMAQALASFDRLSVKTAKRVIEFYDRRMAHAHANVAGAEPTEAAVA